MAKPGLIITGATGFLGRQLVRQLMKEYFVYAFGRRSPQEVRAVEGGGVRWFQVDIGDRERLREVFGTIAGRGGADQLLHMAAYYDFTGDDHEEYERTNVAGTANVLELAETLRLRQFIFVSSVAACPFPAAGDTVRETTPASAPIPYARSKRTGEEMVRRFAHRVPSCIVRPAAVFSDWCEYEPLEAFMAAWCSRRWNARVLGGRGLSAVPYLHVHDLLSFFVRVVERVERLEPGEVLIASPDGSTTHADLFREVTRCFFGAPRRALHVPRALARPGVRIREWWSRRRGRVPFERAWMVDYIDRRLDVDASRTRRRLDWAPDPSFHVLARIPTMIEHMIASPDEWRFRSERKRSRFTASRPPVPAPGR